MPKGHPMIRYLIRWFGVCVVLYVSSYCFLSIQGTYGAAVVGGNGVKLYRWYAKGMSGSQKLWVWRFYAPLSELDHSIWHTDSRRLSGEYPSMDWIP